MNWSKALVGLVLASFAIACSSAPVGALTDETKTAGEDKDKADDDKKSEDEEKPTERTATASMSLTSVLPATVKVGSAAGGLTVTLTGKGFASGMKLAIGETRVATTVSNETSLTAIIPASELDTPTNLTLALVGSDDTRSNEITLTVTADEEGEDILTGLSPISTDVRLSNSGSLTLTVLGSGFITGDVVVFNGTEVPTTRSSATALKGKIASSLLRAAGQVNVAVKHDGKLSAPLVFTINDDDFETGNCNGGATCSELGLARNQCTVMDGDLIQCWTDGCVYLGCE